MNSEPVVSVKAVSTRTGEINPNPPGPLGDSGPDTTGFSGVLRETIQNRPGGLLPAPMHTVRAGENLSQIVSRTLKMNGQSGPLAARQLHEAVQRVARHNRLINPDLIHPGQQLDLSPLFTRQTDRPAAVAAPPAISRATAPACDVLPASVPMTRAAVAMAMTTAAVTSSSAVLKAAPADPGLDGLVRQLRTVQTALSRMLPLGVAAAPRPTRTGSSEQAATGSVVRTTLAGIKTDAPSWSGVLSGHVTVTSDFGFRKDPFTGKRTFHEGVDLTSDAGAEVRAFATGIVTHSDWLAGYGKTVILRHADGTQTLYGHCDRVHVSIGDVVSRGAALAVMGSTGRSTGSHLHFEVRRNGRPVDPLKVLLGERDYGEYYAGRNGPTRKAGKTGRINTLHPAVRGYSTLPAATLPRAGRP